MSEMDYTVTLTDKDIAFRERARAAGIPSMMVSMYARALQRLVEDEREECAKVCEAGVVQTTKWDASYWNRACEDAAFRIRARGKE